MAIQATGGNVGGTTWGNSRGNGGGRPKPKPAPHRSGGNGTGVQRMGGGDYNFIPPNPTQIAAVQKATSSAVGGRSSGSSYRGGGGGGPVYTGPSAAEIAAQQAAAREKQIRDAYGQAQGQNATLYDTAYATIADKKHELADNYGKAINSIQLDLHNQTNATRAAEKQRDNDQATAAARMGLDFVPQSGGRADATDAANLQAVNMHENAWRGLLNSQKLTAIERNQAAADVFKNSKAQEAAIIRKQMLAALGLA